MYELSVEEKKEILKNRLTAKLKVGGKTQAKGSFLNKRLDLLNTRRNKLDEFGLNFFEQTIDSYDGAWVNIGDKRLLMMASYSYLGLIGHPYIRKSSILATHKYGTGTHGVRILAGTVNDHKQLESTIADFKKTEDAIVYSSGYVANLSTISTLTGPGDLVICDTYNHASIVDGCRLSGAEVVFFDHNDMASLKTKLKESPHPGKLVIADGVFSMDGDIADIPEMVALCRKFDASLMIDEAHSIGILGEDGSGVEAHFGLSSGDIDIKMGTLSKTIPAVGGYVAGSESLIGALKSNANGYIFSAAIPPSVAAAAKASFEIIMNEQDRVKKLQENVNRYMTGIKKLGFNTLLSQTAIVPIICNDEETTLEMTRISMEENVFALPVVYPAVPVHLPRLRTTMTASHSFDDIDFCLHVFEKAGKQTGLI